MTAGGSIVLPSTKIFIAGHRGLVGSALVRRCLAHGYSNLIMRTHAELDLCNSVATEAFFAQERPEYVFLAAAKVGGIGANQTYPADFIYSNLMITTSVIEAARRWGVSRLIFFGSTCAYPRDCEQPMREDYLLTGQLESSSEPYAISKIAGMKLCEAFNAQYGTEFITVIPSTLYGPHDNFDPLSSHVLSALLRRFHEAREQIGGRGPMTVWGTGTPLREFLYVDDLAEACLLLAGLDSAALGRICPSPAMRLNVGSGQEISIKDLAVLISEIVGARGELVFDHTKPDGTPRKILDSTAFGHTGWTPTTALAEGIRQTYDWYCDTLVAGKILSGG